jgi:cytochrome bd ubiquinol oxidase subunit II
VVASIFFELYPRVMVSSTNSAYNLTVSNSASPSYSLRVMTVVAVIFFPIILLYQGWSLYIFRKRISGGPPSVVAAPVEPDDPPPAPTQTPIAAAGE